MASIVIPVIPNKAPITHCFVTWKSRLKYSIIADKIGAEPIETTVPMLTPDKRIEE